jgi:hypothetical protein
VLICSCADSADVSAAHPDQAYPLEAVLAMDRPAVSLAFSMSLASCDAAIDIHMLSSDIDRDKKLSYAKLKFHGNVTCTYCLFSFVQRKRMRTVMAQQQSDTTRDAHASTTNRPATAQAAPTAQEPTIDMDALGAMLASAVTNASNSAASQKPKRDILGIYNAVVATLAFLGTLFLSTFGTYWVQSKLNDQNNQLQKQFTQFQREFNTANIQLVSLTNSSFSIFNNGEASASNVRISVSLLYVYSNWTKDIRDIRNITFGLSDNALLDSINYTSGNIPYTQEIPGDKVANINLTQLPLGETLKVSINPPSVALSDFQYSTSANVYFKSADLPESYNKSGHDFGLDALSAYFDDLFGVAAFEINIVCANCASFPSVVFRDSAASPLFSPTSNQELAGGVVEEGFKAFGEYFLPKGIKPQQIASFLYLTVGLVLRSTLDAPERFTVLRTNFHDIQNGYYAWPDFILRSCKSSDCPNTFANG